MNTQYGFDTWFGFLPAYTVGIIIFLLICLGALIAFYLLGGFKEIKKIWCDIHINPATGGYSQKRLAMSFSFLLGWFICFSQAFNIKIYPTQEFNSQPVSIWIPVLLFSVGLGTTAAVLMGHLNARKTTDKQGNPLTPPYTEPVYTDEVPVEGETTETPTDTDDFTPPSFAPKIKEKYRIPTARQL